MSTPSPERKMATAIEAFVAALPDPDSADVSAVAKVQATVDRMVLNIRGYLNGPKMDPEVTIYIRPDRTFYWNVNRANGITFRPDCSHRQFIERVEHRCDAEATEMVGPESMCAVHAEVRRVENARHDAAMRAWAESPEGIAEARREQAWEARVS